MIDIHICYQKPPSTSKLVLTKWIPLEVFVFNLLSLLMNKFEGKKLLIDQSEAKSPR